MVLLACTGEGVGPAATDGEFAPAFDSADGAPVYEIDPFWPPPLPNDWMLGQIGGLFVDARDHVWVLSRPRTLDEYDTYAAAEPPRAACCIAAPPVIEFDQAGNVVQWWGGPGEGYEWPTNEHGIFVDAQDSVWIGGNGDTDHQLLKFSRDGTFLMQIGRAGASAGSNDTGNVNRPAAMVVHEPTGELFVADGYGNRRVVVFDAATGEYRRHWGAYGNLPDDAAPVVSSTDGPGSPQFNTVHGLVVSDDELVYVADRVNKRIQVFELDGTFVDEAYLARETTSPEGTAYGFALSPDADQRFLYVPDGSNKTLHVLDRATLDEVGVIGGGGGHMAGQFFHLHVVGADSQGTVYTGEGQGKRVQRFVRQAVRP